ncbi:hypothetical protein VNO80_35519 [Phaseolus coccineus]|uniref:DNA-directed RNA polymerase n=1 Tax=Phaseolus coccineus TaxID=3886 RepID=A0AAN9Q4L1_PHACN
MGINMLRPCMALNMHLQVVVRYFHNTSSLEENVGDNEDLVNKKKKNTKEDKENKKKNTKEDKENKKKNTKEDKENMCSPEDLVNKKKKNTKEDKENKKKNTKEDLVNNNHTSETYNEETNNKEDTDSDSDSDTNTKQDNWINWKLIKQDQTNARDYLLPKLSEKDANLLQVFNQYTIEALIVHLLAQLFNNSEDNLIIRVATLIEQLDLIVRNQASFFKSRMKVNKEVSEEVPEEVQDFKKSKKKKKINDLFPIGIGLVEFLEERKLIEFTTDIKSQDKVVTKKDIQQARYERFILRLAQAYDGYQFYLPVFLDFRGRIYRCGLLHFHERDLVRSLIIMSWLLLDTKMAVMTNLIPSGDFKKDVYLILLEDLKKYISSKLNNPALSDILQRNLDRKIVKSIFMPLIYGKTIISTIDDIKKSLLHYLTQKECVEIAKLCFEFWKSKYDQMNNLIVLIRSIGYFVAYINRGVIYSNPYYVTIQDYMKMDKIKIWIYDKNQKKRRQVTLKMASSKRDCRKTEISTFVNFIHQKDAQIAIFDGILLLKHLACHHASYKLKPLMRNNRLYEIAVYSGNKMLFRFRDSLNHLPGKLDNLAKSLCPDLDHIGKLVVKSLKRELKQLQIEKKTLNEKFMNERELDERKNTDRSMLTTPKTDDEDEDLKPPDSRPEEKNT